MTWRKPNNPEEPSLLNLDQELVSLIVQRTKALAEDSSKRRGRKGKVVDPALEKALWAGWKSKAEPGRLNLTLLRQIFGLLNALGYGQAEGPAAERGYVLTPSQAPLAVDAQGPKDLFLTRSSVYLGAALNHQFTLSDVILNDPLIALVKALNQAGAALSWEEHSIHHQLSQGLRLDGKIIFCGQDPFNAFLLLCSALSQLGTVKFTGGADLRSIDLSEIGKILSQCGARLVHLDPHSSGFPVRLECSGMIPDRILLPRNTPPSFARALILAMAGLNQTLHWQMHHDDQSRFFTPPLIAVLQQFGVNSELTTDGVFFQEKTSKVNQKINLPLDAEMAAYLLAMPLAHGGTVRLNGNWPVDNPDASYFLALLSELATMTQGPGWIQSNPKADKCKLDIKANPTSLPFALALAIIAKSEAEIRVKLTSDLVDAWESIARTLAIDFELTSDGLRILGPKRLPSGPAEFHAPNARWALAFSLMAMIYPGATLLNPGIVSDHWPQFWSIYNSLPFGSGKRLIKTEEASAHQPRRRRIEK